MQADGSGPVHTLREGITPEMVAAVQYEYETEDRVIRESRHTAHQHHLPGIHLPGHHRGPAEQQHREAGH
jgi:hypothetical protein